MPLNQSGSGKPLGNADTASLPSRNLDALSPYLPEGYASAKLDVSAKLDEAREHFDELGVHKNSLGGLSYEEGDNTQEGTLPLDEKTLKQRQDAAVLKARERRVTREKRMAGSANPDGQLGAAETNRKSAWRTLKKDFVEDEDD